MRGSDREDVRAEFVSQQDGGKGCDGRCHERRRHDPFMHKTWDEARRKNLEDRGWRVKRNLPLRRTQISYAAAVSTPTPLSSIAGKYQISRADMD